MPAFVMLCGVLFTLAPAAGTAEVPTLDWRIDGPALGTGIAMVGVGELLLPGLPPPWGALPAPDISQVDPLDRAAMFSYSHTLDLASTVLEYGTPAATLALLFLAAPVADALPLGVVYLESVFFALGVKNAVNYLVPRYRPYMYEGGAPGVDSSEDHRSFPSGHTTFAFAAATAGVTLFSRYAPDSPLFAPFAAASYTLAVATGALRILSGMHFLTDVLTGAAVGSLFGYFVPILHDKLMPSKDGRVGLGLQVDAQGITLSYSY
jgi:membrane-associated phospholipid phosphatase